MATEIQEPSDIPVSAITDETERFFRVLVYQMATDNAGIKTLSIADWRNYFHFNSNAVDNVATFVGIDTSEYNYKNDGPLPLPQGVYSIVTRIQAVADQAGVTTSPAPGVNSLASRIDTLEDYVKDGWIDDTQTPPVNYNGLLTRVKENETDIANLEAEVGGGGGGGSTLTSRIEALETTVDTPTTGLSDRTSALETKVGNPAASPDPATGLFLAIDNTNADVTTLNNIVGTTGYPSAKGDLKTRVENLETTAGSAYKYSGNLTGVTPASGETTSITVDGATINIADMDEDYNGNVYNLSISSDTITITISGVEKTFTKDSNIVWVYNTSTNAGYFDELGTTIDISRITDLETEVNTLTSKVQDLENKFITADTTPSWSSDGLDGFYIVTGYQSQPSSKMDSFIGQFSNGACYVHNTINDSNNFFSFAATSPYKVTAANGIQVCLTQIG